MGTPGDGHGDWGEVRLGDGDPLDARSVDRVEGQRQLLAVIGGEDQLLRLLKGWLVGWLVRCGFDVWVCAVLRLVWRGRGEGIYIVK